MLYAGFKLLVLKFKGDVDNHDFGLVVAIDFVPYRLL